MTKKKIVTVLVLSIFFILLIPFQVYVENMADTVNAQLLLLQAADDAGFSDLMTTKTMLKCAVGFIQALKVFSGAIIVLTISTMIKKQK